MMGCHNMQTKIEDGEGLKILLVDKDMRSLKYMSSVLEEHSYIVEGTQLASKGLSMIFESRMEFDLIICEIDMQGMDGFQFLNHITSKADIPTLLISESEDIEWPRKAIKEGACFFFHKPIAKHNLANIWQHVLRYRSDKNQLMQGLIHRDMEKYLEALHGKPKSTFLTLEMKNPGIIGSSSTVFVENQSSTNNENGCYTGGDVQLLGKRSREEDGISSSASSPLGDGNRSEEKQKEKTPRLNWTPQLQQKFKDAYEALGENRATPTRIKELMNEPKITPQHISSYLQKFRSRIKAQKEEASKPAMANPMQGSISMPKSCLGSYPTFSLNSSQAPYQFNLQLNIPRPNLVPNVMPSYHNTSGNLMRNASVFNYRANPSTNVSNNVFQSLFPGLRPQQPISGAGHFNTNVGIYQFLPERNPEVVVQEQNGGLGMGRGNIGSRGTMFGGHEVGRVQGQHVRNNIRMSKELTPEEIDNILQHFPEDDSGKDGESPEANGSASSVTQPLLPHAETATAGETDTQTSSTHNVVEEDMEKFLNMDQFAANSDEDDA